MKRKKLEVIYEDNHLIAVNKPAGYLVQGDATGDLPLIEIVKRYIKHKYNKPGNVYLGLIHRLDRPVSGAVVFAKTSKALTRMNDLFKTGKVKKVYLAISPERPKPMEGELVHFLVKNKEKNFTNAYLKPKVKGAKKSVLNYQLLASIGNHHLIEVHPKTGRPHQIRVQLAKLGSVIRGDLKYGANQKNMDGRIHLHSKSLTFTHPTTKETITIEASIPKEQLWNQFEGF